MIIMYIWLIEDKEADDWDIYDGHVVVAPTEDRARVLCPYADEGDIWTDKTKTVCLCLGEAIHPHERVVLSSFRAG